MEPKGSAPRSPNQFGHHDTSSFKFSSAMQVAHFDVPTVLFLLSKKAACLSGIEMF